LVVGHWSSGLVGALFVAIAGNLEGLLEVLYTRGIGPAAFWQWLDIKDLNVPAVATGGWLPDRYWWWWRASRVVHDVILGQEAEVIDEFPFFSFMLGDMHPHVLALPFVLMAIGLALNLMLEARNWKLEPGSWKLEVGSWKLEVGSWKLEVGSWKGILLYAVALGALAFLNTWDFPIYVALVTLAFGSGLALSNGLTGAVLGRTVGAGATFGVLGFLFYLPFYLGFQSQAGGVLPNLLFPTRLSQYLVMFGPFLVISAVLLVMLSRATPARELRRGFLGALPGTLLLPPLFLGLVLFASVALPPVRAFVETLLDNPVVRASVGGRSVSQLAGLVVQVRVATPWTYLLLAGLIAWAAGLLWAWLARGWSVGQPFQAARIERLPSDIFAVLLIGLGLLLTFSVEFIYLKDSFGTRMNTVFKFYYQAWILLALASAYGLSRLAGRDTAFALRLPALTLAGLLVAASLIYPVGATWTKAGGFRGPATLDGLAFFKQARPADYDAIEWLKANVADQPIVLQATGGSYSDAGWIAAATGLPTVLGWGFHELQWRGTYDEPGKREPVIQQIYQSGDVQTVRKLLDEWQIEYVYIGPVERDRYKLSPPQIDKFGRFMGKVYDRAGVVIYRR
jgi:YYY domain-containing protein